MLQLPSSPLLSPRWLTGPKACRCPPCLFGSSLLKPGVLGPPLENDLQPPLLRPLTG